MNDRGGQNPGRQNDDRVPYLEAIPRGKEMSIHPNAGKPASPSQLADIPKLITAYYAGRPGSCGTNPSVSSFGTSGHRGTSFANGFNEAHILAITQAICEYRAANGIDGPVFLAKDTHALSEPAFVSALEVLRPIESK